ncbi:hypothetical protein [Telluribacter sp.]|uniref:hypothetical protein n=1 Tax=Telluribacter sp. TaxID=1978767 RepID=UPI002E151FA7|nr:hypothetical protein [Telluribacter sp.]
MKKSFWAAGIFFLTVVVGLGFSQKQEEGTPILYRKVPIPQAFLTTTDGLTYGGDLRMGDLTNDGRADFLVYRAANSVGGGAVQPCFIGAFDESGKVLWQKGAGGLQPNRPGPVTIFDIDADGSNEVITFFVEEGKTVEPQSMANVSVQILDGKTGRVKRQANPPELTSSQGKGPNWVHQRILIANLRGKSSPQDFIVKLGTKIIAFDNELRVLWTYENQWDEYANCPAYVPALGDMDNDGRDEINGGYYVLNAGGQPLWEKKLGKNMDAVVIDYWDDPKKKRAFCSGFGHVMDQEGNAVLNLGEALVPHGQELRVAHFDDAAPGPQMMIRYNGHHTDMMLVGQEGEILRRFKVNQSPNNTGMDVIYWNGPTKPAHLYNGGVLWSGKGTLAHQFPALPETQGDQRQGWYHCIPADVAGDSREEAVLYNPWDRYVFIFTPEPLLPEKFSRYQPSPRQYNVRLLD